MLRELEYQSRVFNMLNRYLRELVICKDKWDKVERLKEQHPSDEIDSVDFTRSAFEKMNEVGLLPISRKGVPFSPRKDGMERPVPNVTFKVPTGGGKTYLAVKSISMILNQFLNSNTGFILWVVPNESIYTQTLKNFRERTHPYRLAFDRAAAGKVKIFTKVDRLNAADVDTNLCVMLLMLQSAKRQSKKTLKIFQDRGNVHGFIPAEGDQQAHRSLLNEIPNLDSYQDETLAMVKDTLANVLRIVRPVVVVDEGHKAISELAYQTLYSFNPSFVLELTATPKDC